MQIFRFPELKIKRSLFIISWLFITFSIEAQTPQLEWVKQLSSTTNDQGFAIVVDGTGNVFTAGTFSETVDFDPGSGKHYLYPTGRNGSEDVFISKLDASGTFIWAINMGGISNDRANSLALDDAGNVYVTGYFQETADFDPDTGQFTLTSKGNEDVFIAKLDASGNLMWSRQLGGISTDFGNAVAIDQFQNMYITGSFKGMADLNTDSLSELLFTSKGESDIFITKLNNEGRFIWSKQIGGSYYDQGNSIKTDETGNVYLSGYFWNMVDFDPGASTHLLYSSGWSDAFILKLDTTGNIIWVEQFGGGDSDEGNALTLDQSGNLLVTGTFKYTAHNDPGPDAVQLTSSGENDIFICKMDTSGQFLWAGKMGGNSYDFAYSIATDADGNIYTTGWFSDIADFDPGVSQYPLTANGNQDIFISKLDGSGTFRWAIRMGEALIDIGNAITIDKYDNVYTTGWFQETVDFDPGSGVYNLSASSGTNDIFIHKMLQKKSLLNDIELNSKLFIYPNPCSGEIYISGFPITNNIEISIIDQTGRQVISRNYLANEDNLIEIDVNDLAGGVYTIQIPVLNFNTKVIVIK